MPGATDAQAAEALAAGGLVILPTETVYGLAADATRGEAVARIYAAKGRPAFNPLIVHVRNIAAAEAIALLCLPEARWLNGQIVQNDGGGLYAMQARFFSAAIRSMGGTPGEESPIIGV